MKKLNLYFIFFLFINNVFGQGITVDDTYTAADLANLLLLNDPCVEISNISMSDGQSVAYFNQNSSTFPLTEGVLIRSGQANLTAGQYTDTNLSSPLNNDTDTFLQDLSIQSSGQTTPIVDIAYLEFDFTSSYNLFSFNFLFASNEYGSEQCISNDIFAFALTDLITGTTTNLAVIPGSTDPVSVKNIRNSTHNSGCNSSNPGYFSTYNVPNPSASTLNMRGHTVVMSAGSSIIPARPYKIRLSIADYGDSDYDSAVFLGGSSFNSDFSLGDDQIICSGDEYLLDTGLDSTFTHQWLQNGTVISGEVNSTYTVTAPGTYTVIIDKGSCHIEDTIVFDNLMVNLPIDIYTCDTSSPTETFDLTLNNETTMSLDNSIYDVYYYTSIANINANNPIDSSELNTFQSSGQTIYIKIFNTTTGQFCDAVYPFDLIINSTLVAGTVTPIEFCLGTMTFHSLATHNAEVINGQLGVYILSYYNTQADAIAGTNALPGIVVLPDVAGSVTYWIRINYANNPNCFDVTSVTITINPLPPVDTIDHIIECSTVTLPTITNGFYFDGDGNNLGQGGGVIEDGGTYYITSGPDANGCTNTSSFTVTFLDEFIVALDHCGRFIVPATPANIGAFYTGPSGTGTLIPQGIVFNNPSHTTTIMQPIYFYAEIDGVVCRDDYFEILIHPMPEITYNFEDVTYCDSYTLPTLSNVVYRIKDPTSGLYYPLGDNTLTSSQNVRAIFSLQHIESDGSIGNCLDFVDFTVNIVDTSQFTSSSNCGSFILPEITFGNYYDQSGGQGNIIDPSIPITTSQVVYYYTETTELPNCTENLHYDITITPLPLVDEIPSATYCEEYVLPTLTNGTYYMLPGGPDVEDQMEIQPNTVIDLSGTSLPPGTYYIYNGPDVYGCENEWAFTIDVVPYPETDDVLNSIECNAYSIPTPTNGTVYTSFDGPNGTGIVVTATDVFTEDNTFYIYNEDPTTGCIVDNPFTVFYNGINLPNYPDVSVCDTENYQLPTLTHVPPETTTDYSIGYFYDSGGNNPISNGTIFNTPGTYTVYVYAVNNGRFGISCVEEDSITITVSETPILPNYSSYNGNYCIDFTLPALPTGNFNVNYYLSSGGNATDIINPSDYTFTLQADDTPTTYDVWVYATAIDNTDCFDEEHFQFTLYPPRTFEIPDGIICVDPITSEAIQPYTISSGLNSANYTAEWHLNGNSSPVGTGVNYNATEPGIYTITPIALITEAAPNCSFLPVQMTLTASSAPMASVNITLPFDDLAVATVTIENGVGNYMYSLDNGHFQSSNVFNNLSSGDHTILVSDVLGNCGEALLEFTVIKYPKFFTPNGDNYNDTWNIWDLRQDYPDAVISIFDRYGKFLKQISPTGIGWDGMYNGKPLPSTDYWFTVDFAYQGNQKQFKAHFSMKR